MALDLIKPKNENLVAKIPPQNIPLVPMNAVTLESKPKSPSSPSQISSKISRASLKRLPKQISTCSTGYKQQKEPRFRDIFLQSDIHGLREWYESNNWTTKFIWTAILIAAISLLVLELVHVLRGYQESPILTTYSVAFEPRGIKFPNVYICPMSPVHYETLKWRNVSADWLEKNNVTRLFDASNFANDGNIMGQRFNLWDGIFSETGYGWSGDSCVKQSEPYFPKDIQDYFFETGFPMDTLFKECAFNARVFKCSDHTTPIFDKDYGKCFLLNLTQFTQTTNDRGLSLVLNLDAQNAFNEDDPQMHNGMLVRVGEHDFPMTYQDKNFVSPRTYSKIKLSKTKYNLMEKVRTSGASQTCVKPKDGHDSLKILNASYDMEVCKIDCVQRLLLNKCSCLLPMDKKFLLKNSVRHLRNEDLFCNSTRIGDCARDVLQNSFSSEQDFTLCFDSCKVPCEFVRYTTSETAANDFPSKNQYLRTLFRKMQSQEQAQAENGETDSDDPCSPGKNKEMTSSDWMQSAVVDIAFPALEWAEISQESSMTFTSFVSEVGGQVGLWLGASIVTIVKLFVICVPVFSAAICAKLKHIRTTVWSVDSAVRSKSVV